MRRRFASLLVLLLIPGVALVQPADNKIDTPAEFEQFLKESLKKTFKKTQIGEGTSRYKVKDSFTAEVQEKQKTLLLYEQYTYEVPQALRAGEAAMLDKVKKWNAKAKFSRATVRSSNPHGDSSIHTVRFSGTVDLSKGVSPKQLKDFYNKLDDEFDEWVIFMQDLRKHDKKEKK